MFAVDLGPLDAADRGDLGAADVVHREHARGRVVVHGQGNDDVLEVAELMGDGDEVARLFAVIELGEQRSLELLEDARDVDVLRGADVVEDDRNVLERGEIPVNLLADARALHLDGDLAAAAQDGAMHLAERGGGNRQAIELEEGVRHADAQLLANGPLDVFVRERLDVVLQPRERVQVRRRKQVGARGEDLSELDERRAERFEVLDERRGGGWIGRAGLLAVQRVRDEVSAPVLGDEPREILVSPEASRHASRLSNLQAAAST